MSLFTKNKEHEVQSLMLNLVNNNCPELKGLADGPRLERRVNLTVVVLVIPVEKGKVLIEERFAAVTKEFTSRGLSLVLHECRAAETVTVSGTGGSAVTWSDGVSISASRVSPPCRTISEKASGSCAATVAGASVRVEP